MNSLATSQMPKSQHVVLSNTTPIIALSLIQKLDLYRDLYKEVFIPPAVQAELFAGGNRAGAMELRQVSYIRTVELKDFGRADMLSDLDRGEAEVIALALEMDADLVIIDERLGRRHAQRLGLAITGVLGVLLRAKEQKLVAEIEPLITQLRQSKIRLSDSLIERILQIAGER